MLVVVIIVIIWVPLGRVYILVSVEEAEELLELDASLTFCCDLKYFSIVESSIPRPNFTTNLSLAELEGKLIILKRFWLEVIGPNDE